MGGRRGEGDDPPLHKKLNNLPDRGGTHPSEFSRWKMKSNWRPTFWINKNYFCIYYTFFLCFFACNFLLRLLQSIPRFAVKFDILLFIGFHPYDNIFCCNIIYILALSYTFYLTFLFFFFPFLMTVIYNISKLFIIYLFDCLNCFRIIIISRNFEKFFMVFKRREKKEKKERKYTFTISRN